MIYYWLILLAYLPMVVVMHAGWQWVLARQQKPPQTAASLAAFPLVPVFLLLILIIRWSSAHLWPELIFAGVSLCTAAIGYFGCFCVTESGRRYYLCELVSAHPGISVRELEQLYGVDYMVKVRLERLIAWNVVQESEGKLILRKGKMYYSSLVFYGWSKVLGYRWLAFDVWAKKTSIRD